MLSDESKSDYVHRIRDDLGLTMVGRGFNAHVFQHPAIDDMVVKVVVDHDKGYFYYFRWVLKNQNNPFVPKIYDIRKIQCTNPEADGPKYSIIFMEKLEHIDDYEYHEFMAEMECIDPKHYTTDDIAHARDHSRNDHLRAVLTHLMNRPTSIDFHKGNFMKRGKQIVIIDPLVGC